MAWTYTDSPATVPRDAVRLLTGDTDSLDPLLTDAEIAFYLSENGSNIYRAASEACKAIAAELLRLPDVRTGRVAISNRDRAKDLLALAEDLKKRFLSTVAPYAGGISKADKQTREEDDDRVEPFFTRNLFVQPGTTPVTTSTPD